MPHDPPADSWRTEVLGRMAGGIAHDFNTVLLVITAGAERIATACPPLCRAEADRILQATERGARLARQVLHFGRPEGDPGGPADLNLIVRENLELMAHLLGPKTQVVTELSVAPLRVQARPSLVERILANLLTNARDATTEGDRVTVRTATLPDGHPSVPAPAILLQVEDTGVGMQADVQARMFEPYFTTKPDGTGLGLSIVAELVRESGGWIGATSRPGQGTRFDVVLPGAANPG